MKTGRKRREFKKEKTAKRWSGRERERGREKERKRGRERERERESISLQPRREGKLSELIFK